MSRHKIVKNMDLDDEMDDYDGGEDYADDGAEGLLPTFYIPPHACIETPANPRPQSSAKKTKVRHFHNYPASPPARSKADHQQSL